MQKIRGKPSISVGELGAEWGFHLPDARVFYGHPRDDQFESEKESVTKYFWQGLNRVGPKEKHWATWWVDAFEVAAGPTSLVGEYLSRLLEANRSEDKRLRQVNQYFKIKAGDVLSDESCVKFLANLYQANAMAYEEIDINEKSLALAKLAAAGFAELGELKFQITESGCRFIDSLTTE